MKEYTIQPGQQNFSPIESPLPRFGAGFEFEAVFGASCWWPASEWQHDRDYYDWNKLTGLTWFFSGNNHTSPQVAWRPGNIQHTIVIAPYLNYPKTIWKTGETMTIKTGDRLTGKVRIERRRIVYRLECNGEHLECIFPFRRPWPAVWRQVGTWIGGANNEPGPYGGKATKNMNLWLDFKMI